MLVQKPQRHHQFESRHLAASVPQLDLLSLNPSHEISTTSLLSSFESPDYYYNPHLISSRTAATLSPTPSADFTPSKPRMSGSPNNPPIHIQSSTPARTQDQVSMNEGDYQYHQSWPAPGFVTPQLQHQRLAPAFLGHKRLSSDSSIATSGLNSPHSQSSAYPYIVDSDNYSVPSPHLEPYDTTSAFFPKASSTTQPTFSESFCTPAFEGYNPTYDDVNAYMGTQTATRQGMSGQNGNSMDHGGSSSGAGYRYRNGRTPSDARQQVPMFDRTLTDIYQDELYRPCIEDNTSYPSSQQQQYSSQANLLSPTTPSVLTSRLQQAQEIRSLSPPQDISREKSPFRTGSAAYSELYSGAVSTPDRSPASRLNTAKTATQMREQEKARADALAIAQHTPHDFDDAVAAAGSESPKTISPREALIDGPDIDEVGQVPLFPQQQDQVAAMSQQQNQQGNMASRRRQQQPANLLQSNNNTQPQYAFLRRQSTQRSSGGSGGGSVGANDNLDFPSTLTSMESTRSDTSERVIQLPQQSSTSPDIPDSSQRSTDLPSPLRRPENTAANSGSYTCHVQPCTARFSNATGLQKHKRDAHPGEPSAARTPVSATFPASPARYSHQPTTPTSVISPTSPNAPTTASSQLGPHKCTRLNPSTGKSCNTIFSRSYDLTRHEDTIHNNRKQKVRCALCTEDKTFSRNDALTRHMRVVHPEVEWRGGRRGGGASRG